ncbi:MAG TPA: PEP-CTERM-box response regulator transcription factor [Deltaproteobacteria bacterium]|nr:PEP-CTERM-box response regulator transcription factor [Deltaproteobacteria bacterium]
MEQKPKLLIVDDEESIRTQMKWALIDDYDVYLAADADKAMQLVHAKKPHLVTLDLGLPPTPSDPREGLDLLAKILHFEPGAKVMVVTGDPDKKTALEAVAHGAHDYFTKPIDIEELKMSLRRAHYIYTLEAEHRAMSIRLQQQGFSAIIGSCRPMQKIFDAVRKVATTDVPVLVTGESGTGKELVAMAIHKQSARQGKPFVPINCGAIPETLMESELFGHEKGAFTGAHVQRKGKVEQADGGTLFLDEIGELAPALQVKLLRFLQDHTIERVGGRRTIEVDVRIIAATNKDLVRLIEEGLFREDLYYRLAVVNIELPPLRERGEDKVLLAKSFLQKFGDSRAGPRHLSREAVEAINAHDWPGNVRELENRMRRAITLAEGPSITPSDLGLEETAGTAMRLDLRKAREELETRYVNMALVKHNGNITKAAEELGLTRPTLHSMMKKYGIVTQR